jgi:lipase chaperone LimK
MRGWLAGGALVAATALAWLSWEATRTVADRSPPVASAPAASAPEVAAARPAERTRTVETSNVATAPARASSLEGTDVDGAWPRDERGRFTAGPELLRRFDYYLSATGEEDAAAIRAHVVASAAAELLPADVERAVAMYDRYVGYRAALVAAAVGGGGAVAPRAVLALVARAQAEAFGSEDADRLFGEENARREAAITRYEAAMARYEAQR